MAGYSVLPQKWGDNSRLAVGDVDRAERVDRREDRDLAALASLRAVGTRPPPPSLSPVPNPRSAESPQAVQPPAGSGNQRRLRPVQAGGICWRR
jgi:hypothetical protein